VVARHRHPRGEHRRQPGHRGGSVTGALAVLGSPAGLAAEATMGAQLLQTVARGDRLARGHGLPWPGGAPIARYVRPSAVSWSAACHAGRSAGSTRAWLVKGRHPVARWWRPVDIDAPFPGRLDDVSSGPRAGRWAGTVKNLLSVETTESGPCLVARVRGHVDYSEATLSR
jgi:hypothetical protein